MGNSITEGHHGDCIGADEEFNSICAKYGIKIVIHPSSNIASRAFCNGNIVLDPKEQYERCKDIVLASDIVIVMPSDQAIQNPIGSEAMFVLKYATKLGKKIFFIYPNGKCTSLASNSNGIKSIFSIGTI